MEYKSKFQKFEGSTVKECLKNASIALGISKELLKYSIVDEKRGLFKKHVIISIDSIEELPGDVSLNVKLVKRDDLKTDIYNEKDGTIEIKNGKIIVKNPCDGGKLADRKSVV